MTALGTQCVHPETQKSYIKSISGGKNNSTEPVRVRISPDPIHPVSWKRFSVFRSRNDPSSAIWSLQYKSCGGLTVESIGTVHLRLDR